MKLRRRFKGLILAAAVLAFLLSATAALAVPITYTFSGTGSGTWGLESFFDVFFSVTLPGDTGNVTVSSPGIWQNTNLTGTIDISGLGTGTFTPPLLVFVNNNLDAVGFSDSAYAYDYLDLYKAGVGLDTYQLTTSFGPVTNPDSMYLDINGVATSQGDLSFTGVEQASLTFSANAVPVPDPVLLLGSGLLSLLGYGYRKGRKLW